MAQSLWFRERSPGKRATIDLSTQTLISIEDFTY
jgi:hypothetical protein